MDSVSQSASAGQSSAAWVAYYKEPLRALRMAHDSIARDVLDVLVECADAYGWCFPGDAYIAEQAGRARETVSDALKRLETMNYIRLIYSFNPRRKRNDRDILISPYVIALPTENRRTAEDAWHNLIRSEALSHSPDKRIQTFQQTLREDVTRSETDDHYRVFSPSTDHYRVFSPSGDHDQPDQPSDPTTDQPPITNTMINPHNHHQHQQQPGDGGSDAATLFQNPPESAPDGAQDDETREQVSNHQQGENRPAQRRMALPNQTSAGRAPDKLETFADPLPDELYERVALEMKEASGRSLAMPVARGLVLRYGASVCRAAVQQLAQKRRISNPGGHLRWMIETQHVDPEIDGKNGYEDLAGRW